jgi:hypothetical protein
MRTNHRIVILAMVISMVSVARAEEQPKAPATQPAGNVSGTYVWTMEGRDGQTREVTLTLSQEGQKLTGSISGWRGENEIEDGKVNADGSVSFKVTRTWNDNTVTTIYSATVTGDAIKGKSETDRNGEIMTREFDGKRQK